jgi:hypothetical protein
MTNLDNCLQLQLGSLLPGKDGLVFHDFVNPVVLVAKFFVSATFRHGFIILGDVSIQLSNADRVQTSASLIRFWISPRA